MPTPLKITAKIHDHLDGSFPLLDILPQMWRMTHGDKKPYPFFEDKSHHEHVRAWFGNPLKGDIVKKFSLTTGVMQNSDTLYMAAKRYVEIRAQQGFRYCEPIIAPQYHTFMGLTIQQVVEALIRGIKRGEMEYPEIEVNLLLGIGREISADEAVNLVRLFGESEREYVAGITLVCDESKNPPEKHTKAYRMAQAIGFKTACHAGEWVHNVETQNPNFNRDISALLKNCRTAVELLRVNRIEHAMPLAYDKELVKVVRGQGIGHSSCPGSYWTTGLMPIERLTSLMLADLLCKNIMTAVDADDDLFMPDVSEVLRICHQAYKFSNEELKKMYVNPWKIRFGNRKPIPEEILKLM